jgi:hypothetical protein
MIEFLEGVLARLHPGQHTISTSLVEIDGDQASARTAAQVMMGFCARRRMARHTDRALVSRCSGENAQGWRIAKRVQEYGWIRT